MEKSSVVSLAALIALIAVTAGSVSAADNVSNGTIICSIVGTNYQCDSWSNEQYPVVDISGDKYVPLFTAEGNILDLHANKLASLVIDSNETRILKPGENIDLGHGYALEVKQINVDYEEVWLELTRDGQYIADQIIPVETDGNNTWTVSFDNIQDENDIVVMKVYMSNIFVGAVDCIVRIDGIWLIDYQNAKTLNIGDKLGEFTLKEIVNGTDESNLGSLVFENTAGNTTEPSAICSVTGTDYELDNWSGEQYPLINLFGDYYVPLFSDGDEMWQSHVNKLASLILDSNETYTLKPGETLDLGNGYALEVREIDIDSENVLLEFTKDSEYVADKRVSIDTDENKTWTVTLDNVQGEDDIVVMKVHIKNLFVGKETSVVWIDGIWLIDYANARTLNVGDKPGEFTLKQIVSGVDASNLGSLVFENTSVPDNASVSDNASVTDDVHSSDSPAFTSPQKEQVKFIDKNIGSPTSWYWNFWRPIQIKSK